MNTLDFIIVAVSGYIIGLIPFAVIIAKSYGIDILHTGSCNAGATNVKRSVGEQAGNLVFFLDMIKGLLAAGLPFIYSIHCPDPALLGAFGLCAAITGHTFPIVAKFKGGRGVSTAIGGMLILMTIPILIALIIWLATFHTCRYVSLASILLISSLPPIVFFMNLSVLLFWFSLLTAMFIIIRHKSNIYRLSRGEENHFTSREYYK